MGSSVFLQIELKEKWYSTLNRWLSSASCKPERDHQPTMPLSSSWYHLARPLFRHYAHLSTWSHTSLSLLSPHLIYTRRLDHVLSLFGALSPSVLSQPSRLVVLKEPGERHRPKIKQSAFQATTIHLSTPPIKPVDSL